MFSIASSTCIEFLVTSFSIFLILDSSLLCKAFVTVSIAVSASLAFVNSFVPVFVSITFILPSSDTYIAGVIVGTLEFSTSKGTKFTCSSPVKLLSLSTIVVIAGLICDFAILVAVCFRISLESTYIFP